MLEKIIAFSLKNKLIVLLFTLAVFGFGIFSVFQLSIGAVPDVTNNQVQVITTSGNLSTQDIEQYITYPVEIEMANLPGVKEIRSISKFGLSVVTIVFEDNLGTYLPRQLIAEKIKSASEKIPAGFGTPTMGPITTGLGEIYQYTLEVTPEFKNNYTVTDLRTIQDWIVKRQLSGIKGVVEINTWGGYLKQYEIAINPAQLKAMNIATTDVFTALEKNNSIAGGAYIEKVNQSYFIRAEGKVNSLEDIQNIVVKNSNGFPIYIKDVADVRFGHANRFGAITGNGEGEKVLGQVMMLKGANSKQVINDVKARIAIIEKSLPEGVYINGFLERSELVAKTTFTVAENLILGCLIVIFVVVLLLGNWRSGLVVASVIPLCLLFAISLMNIFGIDANLMSLGAIDFGIIIDGAVIIVEFIAFQIANKAAQLGPMSKEESQLEIDQITYKSASKMMNSAIFGQLIILIVFIPILSLSGIEGKMFKPMAMTFSFALVGAMIFCFTYVPVVSSLFLKPTIENPKSISSRLIRKLNSWYLPIITWALVNTKKVLYGAGSLLVMAIILFITMGGEFIPTLDEGDFVIQPVLKTGTTLTKTIATTTKIEKIILKNFPEVDQVVSRIGAAEVPTDPMSMEESDVIVKLKPKSEWVSANTKDELADKIKAKIEEQIPNMEIEFTQPIEMRFNELISGTRSDVAVKIFGEDLNVLARKAGEIKRAIAKVEGASDIIIEKTEGLPQMTVRYDRSKIARYGLNISDLNEMIALGFAGKTVGNVFEGEKRFDMVIRLDATNRKSINDLKELYITTATGEQVPLEQLASIEYTQGPAKISRDNTNRRIVVGINVRNRDLQSVVTDIQKIVDTEVKLPTGYYVQYGGQFENLQSAKARLMIAVPIALFLIFILLYFAFGSVKEALMVYSAIPLSAVGGVLFLWIRDLPFSISAGVGFIALFGIAVLNGIVLIEHFKELKHQGMKNIDELILKGTTDRLRPVLLTAAAAALGFLPMAISSSAGAEVQRPLATVVIGGLFTATILTMIVLPILYKLFDEKEFKKPKFKKHQSATYMLLFILSSTLGFAQNPSTELDTLIIKGINNNKGLKAYQLQVAKYEANINSAFTFDKTNIYYNYDQNNIAYNNEPLKVFGLQQRFDFPTVYGARKKANATEFEKEKANFEIQKNKLSYEIAKTYHQIVFLQHQEKLYHYLDSLYHNFSTASNRRFELGETNYLEKITAEAKFRQIKTKLTQIGNEKKAAYVTMQNWVQSEDEILIKSSTISPLKSFSNESNRNIHQSYLETVSKNYESQLKLQKQNWLPDLHFDVFRGSNKGISQSLNGFQVGIAVPILYGGNVSKSKVAQLELESWEQQKQNETFRIDNYLSQKQQELAKYQEAINYYNQFGKKLSDEIIKVGNMSYKHGEIDFFQYIQSLENATIIQVDYLDNVLRYNQTQLEIQYLNY
ncbi:CusA/CzcA family heavy metal efflux RND transporter [Flavobacterium muglaense]|uniref:CusA/CzcA family heavy metal efflux RND transporter n=1 Tax=Flavobacterium muglaense TaxID=2764716 RepID=A0A923MZW3_9FLAO|nr:CusA/CzcA family heavy metal efflux RND transporter [Flavobacterium muglaense]MBC5837669.1 CusA/CzcA family heavy metal efflux RND transporter [Flavobacterium muglaense]MBC5844215.1 CusA/CzcA family heavy metal efflux RND transporter [Flavobacterium muglaense]